MTREERAKDLRKGVYDIINSSGITLEFLLKQLKKELNAKDTKFFQHEGEVIEIREVIDWSTRQKARIDAHKLRGDYPAEKQEITGAGGGPIEFSRLERANRIAAIAEAARKRKVNDPS